jgi:hypothetical protein
MQMRLNKLLAPIAFSMLFSSGTTFASERYPWESLYLCSELFDDDRYSKLSDSDKMKYKNAEWDALHFMKDGGVVMQGPLKRGAKRWESYGPITYPELYRSEADTYSLVYNDKGEFHEIILTTIYWFDELFSILGWRTRILIDKELMVGTATRIKIQETGDTDVHKVPYRCESHNFEL